MGAKVESGVPKDPKFNNPVWQENFKKVLPKIMMIISVTDQKLGPKCVTALKELAETPDLGPRMDTYVTMKDYLHDRIDDIAWPYVLPPRYTKQNAHANTLSQVGLCLCRIWGEFKPDTRTNRFRQGCILSSMDP